MALNSVNSIILADNGVVSSKIAPNAVTADKIPNGTITAEKLDPMGAGVGEVLKWDGMDWVPMPDLGSGLSGVAGGDLTGTYPDPNIADNVITSAKIVDGAVDTDDLENGAVTSDKIAYLAVTSDELAPNSVTTVKIADNAVIQPKIADNAVTRTKVASSAITTNKIHPGAVTGEKINQMGAVNGEVLKWDGTTWSPAADNAGGLTGTAGGDLTGTYPNPTIANNVVTSANLHDMGATNNQVLKWNGTTWVPNTDYGGFIEVTENGNTGYRRKDADANNYGDIGDKAFDLSWSVALTNYYGATGAYAFATGVDTKAAGNYTTALGLGTKADAYASTAIGAYNVGGGNPSAVIATDPVFEIGIGADNSNRSNALTVTRLGYVGIRGITAPSYALHLENALFNGQAMAHSWLTYSDGRVKSKRKTIPYGLNEIMQLTPLTYFHHDSEIQNGSIACKTTGKQDIGLIAQEVYKILPEIVNKPKKEAIQLWGMNYEKLTPVLIKAIQELKAENDKLKSTNTQLEKNTQELAGRLSKIEELIGIGTQQATVNRK